MALELVQHRIRNEACPLRVDVAVAGATLTVREEALGNHQVKLVFCSRHGEVEQPTFFLDFRRRAGGKVGWQTPIDRVEQENRGPLLSLGRVDG